VTLLYLVSCCEKDTHYLKDGTCCKKCGPGKRMLVDDNCEDPRCQDCQDGEYQSGYTSENRCERQPSCDPSECKSGYVQNTPGSSTSDQTCVAGTPNYRVLIGVGVSLLIVAIAVFVFIKKRKSGCYKLHKKTIEVLTHGENEDVERAYRPVIQQPQENIDHSVPVSPTLSNLTDNGNYVAQEDGKLTITPTTESNSFS
ncbi:tumor necrosis factor receptor superfamily member 5-like, partial [Sinocyclocheilus grahami]|uniref:tumor necrosis factor receptor superfamily member 5-like n=1 Tax=Sinocyclocheilus grahami TaxID=75366 RepID=UPI0007ACE997